MKIYLVRHGQDDEKFRGGWSNLDLIEEGIIQSQKLAIHLKNKQSKYQIDKIICSDLLRTRHTAEIINKELQLPIENSKEWREMNNGDLAGMENSLAEIKYPKLYFNTLNMDEKYPNGESAIDFFNRVKTSFEKLVYQNSTKNILLITHAGVISIVYHIITNKEWTNKNKPIPIGYASIYAIEKTDINYEITMQNYSEQSVL